MASSGMLGEEEVTSLEPLVVQEAEEKAPARPWPLKTAMGLASLGLALVGVSGAGLIAHKADAAQLTVEPEQEMQPRELQQQFCYAQAPIPQLQSNAFQMPGDWAYACHGQGAHPVPASRGIEPQKYPGAQNFCWHQMKRKGCALDLSRKNWNDIQVQMAAQNLAPPPSVVKMEPVLNAEQCQDPGLGAPSGATPQELQAARDWFNGNVAVYVVSLPTETERRAFISGRLQALGIQFTFIDGIDLGVPGALEQAKAEGIIPMEFDMNAAAQIAGESLGSNVAIAAAHLGAMQKVAMSQQYQPLALILESDVNLEDDFAVKLLRMISYEVPCDWEVISLRSWCPFGQCVSPHLTRVMPDVNEPEGRCHHGVNFCFFSMLYKKDTIANVKAKLSQKVWNPQVPKCLDVDVALAAASDEIAYYAVPAWQKPGFLHQQWFGSERTR